MHFLTARLRQLGALCAFFATVVFECLCSVQFRTISGFYWFEKG